MPLFQLVDFSSNRYNRQTQCADCDEVCERCEACLDNMHFGRTQRRYECGNISYCYVCKYIYKYASEIDWLADAVDLHTMLEDFPDYRMLSIGCGPATELFGLHANMIRNGIDKRLWYRGIDFNRVWEEVHAEIEDEIAPGLENVRVRFNYEDGADFFQNYRPGTTPRNLLVLQYVLSDIANHRLDVSAFVDLIARTIVPTMPEGSVIILNDINHYKATDYYDRLASNLTATHNVFRFHFDNNNRQPFSYGDLHPDNDLRYTVPRDIRERFNPWMYCSGAQMVLQKRA